jgi:hypothetical protein
VPSLSPTGEGQCRRRRNWARAAGGLPGVDEGDMSGRNGQRKHGTTRRRLRRSRRGRAARISRGAVKSRGAGEWGGWGRVSDEGLGQHNPDRSEGPWGSARDRVHGSAGGATLPDTERGVCSALHQGHSGGRQTARGTGMPGAGLTGARAGRSPSSRPCSRTGENPTYGMIGETVETSGALQARSAPLSYPTPRPPCHVTREAIGPTNFRLRGPDMAPRSSRVSPTGS